MFSHRAALVREPNALSQALARRLAQGLPVLDLTVGNPTRAELPYERKGVLTALASPGALVYEPVPFGPLAAREIVAAMWEELGFAVDPGRIVLTASTSEAYSFLLKLLCDPGDDVLVPAPSYPLLEHLARFESVGVRPYTLTYDGAWFLDLASVRAAVGPRTRAILVVSPNNPTGNYAKRSELAALAELGLPIVSDEVFAPFPLARPTDAARSVLEIESVPVFALSGLSKLAALPQMKLGWITVGGPELLVREALARLELLADAFLSPGAPVLAALPDLLLLRHTTTLALADRLRRHVERLAWAFRDTVVTPLPVEGGWYAVLRLPCVQSDEVWALALLEDEGVLVHPGYLFDFAGPPHIVVSLLTPEAVFEAGIERVARYVERATRESPGARSIH